MYIMNFFRSRYLSPSRSHLIQHKKVIIANDDERSETELLKNSHYHIILISPTSRKC